MSNVMEPIFQELEHESEATRRVLERVPEDRLDWRPHPKSMSLGQLALHVATVPKAMLGMLQQDGMDVTTADFKPASPSSKEEVMAALADAVEVARKELAGYDSARAESKWRLHKNGETLFEMSRGAILRSLMLNHLYHHRGQLTVYLRLLDVAVPAVYGISADENPFA